MRLKNVYRNTKLSSLELVDNSGNSWKISRAAEEQAEEAQGEGRSPGAGQTPGDGG